MSTVNKGHGRIEKRTVSICPFHCTQAGWNSITTAIRVESQRITRYKHETETRYYISDLQETAEDFARRIRGYWGVENRVHYCKDEAFALLSKNPGATLLDTVMHQKQAIADTSG